MRLQIYNYFQNQFHSALELAIISKKEKEMEKFKILIRFIFVMSLIQLSQPDQEEMESKYNVSSFSQCYYK